MISTGGKAAPVASGACRDLPAVGTWQNVSPPQLRENNGVPTIPTVLVHPDDPATLYIGGSTVACCGNGSAGIWKSSDCGATWTKLNSGRNSSALDTGWAWGMAINPDNPQVMYAANGYGDPPTLFKSTNGGRDWDQVWDDTVSQYLEYNFAQVPALDITNPDHIVVTMHENCSGDYAPSCLAESTNAGATWTVMKSGSQQWEEAAGPIVLDAHTILLAAPGGLYYTGDNGAQWEKLGDSAYPAFYKADDGTMYLGSSQGLLHSKDGRRWTAYPGTPIFNSLASDGKVLYGSFSYDQTGQPFYSAPLSDPSRWTQIKTPQIKTGSGSMAYDSARHILYAATWDAGLWRVVTH
jgi:photosystem II stability/assembly factor-like uncharacterized protein